MSRNAFYIVFHCVPMGKQQQTAGKLVSLDSRELRNIGHCVGFSLDIDSLREIGIVDDSGEIVSDNASVRVELYDDGTVVAQIDE